MQHVFTTCSRDHVAEEAARFPLSAAMPAVAYLRVLCAVLLFFAVPARCQDGPVTTPVLVSGGLDGDDVVLVFATPAGAVSQTWEFEGQPDAACGDAGWTSADDAFGNTVFTFRRVLTEALVECNFELLPPATSPGTVLYEARVQASVVRASGRSVFGTPVNEVVQTSFPIRVSLPQTSTPDTGDDAGETVEVFGAAVEFVSLTAQEVDVTSVRPTFSWTVVTSVQHPYELSERPQSTNTPPGFDGPAGVSRLDTCAGNSGECRQAFVVTAQASSGVCSFDAGSEVELELFVDCRDDFEGECNIPGLANVLFNFSYEASNFCPQVVEVASVSASMATYSDAPGVTPATSFALQTEMHGRVLLEVEAGLVPRRVELRQLDTGTATLWASGAPTPATSGLVSSTANTDGNPWVDFSVTLSSPETVTFDDDSAASIVLTAIVAVTYEDAQDQRVVTTKGTSPVSSMAVVATAAVDVRPSTASNGSASQASGPSLSDRSTLAGLACACTALVAAGVAFYARKSRGAAATSSTVVDHHDSSFAAKPVQEQRSFSAVPGTNDLHFVQHAYEVDE